MKRALLRVENLHVTFPGDGEPVPAVRDVSFTLHEGERVALVGESGCGKSVIAQAVMRLLPHGTEISGSVHLNDTDIFAQSEKVMEHIRGVKMGMVFQSPERALNPVYKIGKQLIDPLVIHGICDRTAAAKRVRDVLGALGFSDPDWMMNAYPWMCSGGMCQRVLFAAVSLLKPQLVIADEPTKGLDADRLGELEQMLYSISERECSGLLLITHDLNLASRVADRVIVMYSGIILESGDAELILKNPRHPYTRGLIGSLPEHGFMPISGMSPPLTDLPPGCVFHPRCPHATERCNIETPGMSIEDGHEVRCWL